MNKPEVNTIVWDLDNTLWDWVAYAAKAYPAMRDVLISATGTTRQRVTDCMRKYYGRAETMESSWLVQDLEAQGLLHGIRVDRDRLIKDVQKAFHAARSQSLKLYDGVPEVLEATSRAEIRNVIVTDASACHAASRIEHLGLNQIHFQEMFALRDRLPEEVPEQLRKNFDGGRYKLGFPVHHLDSGKPHANLHQLLRMSREEMMDGVAFVGDSLLKDMAHDCVRIHAGWGRPAPEHLRIVSEFSPYRPQASADAVQSVSNIFHASEPRDVLRYLEIE